MRILEKPGSDHKTRPAESQPGRLVLPSLGLRVSERKLLLAGLDIALVNAALAIAVLSWANIDGRPANLLANSKWFLTLIVVWLVTATIFEVYDLARAASGSHILRAIVAAGSLAAVGYLAIPWFTPPLQSRGQSALFVFLAIAGLVAWRLAYVRFFVQPTFQRRALIVGAGGSGRALAQALQSEHARRDANPYRGTGHLLVGFVDDDPAQQGQRVAGLPVLGTSQALVDLVRSRQIDELIIAITHPDQIRPALFEAILDCRELGLPISTMTTVYEHLTGRVAVEHASRNVETAAGRPDTPFIRFHALAQLGMDYAGALAGLLAMGLLIPFVHLANRLASPGPLFFRQTRVGRGGRHFRVYKFRSMIPDAEEESGAIWASADDDRITPIGRLLRRTHLDELPQVINVLRREMSLVGPRPERPEFVCQLSREIPFYRARHCVRPGITGWAQIHQQYGDSFDAALEKLEYDLFYIKHAGPMLDILIILRTVTRVLGLRGR